MFLVFGISSGEKQLGFVQALLCPDCGQFGHWEAYMTYMYFNLFFIPVFHWSRRYYIRSSCCGSLYEIDAALGKRIQRGENVNLTQHDLHKINNNPRETQKYCPTCGYPAAIDYDYCPKCGRKL